LQHRADSGGEGGGDSNDERDRTASQFRTQLEQQQAHTIPIMDWSVFREGLFIVFATSTFLTSVGYLVPYLFLPDRAIKMGYNAKEGALLITILGVTNTVGRVAFGYISDKPCVNRLALYGTVLTIVGVLTTLSIWCADYWSLASYSAIFGFLMGTCPNYLYAQSFVQSRWNVI
jgi:predicted MFS family arabinose efflux permease